MSLAMWNGAVLAAVASLWLVSGTQREKPIVEGPQAARVRTLETRLAERPADPRALGELAQAYLDAHVPGLALNCIESSPAAARREPLVQHLHARALLDQGRAADALVAERNVLEACAPGLSGVSPCDTWLLASATRRADILRELVDLGVEDATMHPEASAVAYRNATREARLAVR